MKVILLNQLILQLIDPNPVNPPKVELKINPILHLLIATNQSQHNN